MKKLLISASILSLMISGNVYASTRVHDGYDHNLQSRRSSSVSLRHSFSQQQIKAFEQQLTEKFNSRVSQSLRNGQSLSWMFNQKDQDFNNSKEMTRAAIQSINETYLSKKKEGAFAEINTLTSGISNFFAVLPKFLDRRIDRYYRGNLLADFMKCMGAIDLTNYQGSLNYLQDIFFEPKSQLVFRFKPDENQLAISAYKPYARQIINDEITRYPDGYIDNQGSQSIWHLFKNKTKNEYAKISILEYYKEGRDTVSYAVNPTPQTPSVNVLGSPKDALATKPTSQASSARGLGRTEVKLKEPTFTYAGRTYTWSQLDSNAKYELNKVFKQLAMGISHNKNIKQFSVRNVPKSNVPVSKENVLNTIKRDGQDFTKSDSNKRKRPLVNSNEPNSKKQKLD